MAMRPPGRTRPMRSKRRTSGNGDAVIGAFPPVSGRPEEREDDFAAGRDGGGIEIGDMGSEAAVARRRVMHRAPVIGAPVDDCDSGKLDAQDASRRHLTALV